MIFLAREQTNLHISTRQHSTRYCLRNGQRRHEVKKCQVNDVFACFLVLCVNETAGHGHKPNACQLKDAHLMINCCHRLPHLTRHGVVSTVLCQSRLALKASSWSSEFDKTSDTNHDATERGRSLTTHRLRASVCVIKVPPAPLCPSSKSPCS